MTAHVRRVRRSISFDDDVQKGILRYRGHQLIKGKKDPKFSRAVNELLREILTQKNIIQSGE